MSLRRLNPFTSSRRTDSDRATIQSTRPPTYTTITTASPNYSSRAASAFDVYEASPLQVHPSHNQSSSVISSLAEGSLNLTSGGDFATTSLSRSPKGPNESVRAWTASVTGASVADFDPLVGDSKSSIMDRRSTSGASSETMSNGPRYLYYRVFAEDGALPSTKSNLAGDPYLGRILSKHVAPPHTVASIKRCLLKLENIDNRTPSSLFLTPTSQSPMNDAGKVTILKHGGPGSIPQEPLALLTSAPRLESRIVESVEGAESVVSSGSDSTPESTRYIYYQLYTEDGATVSRSSFDPEEPFLGRICADFIAPPHTTTSIKKCIARIEHSPALVSAQLFTDISGETSMKGGYVSILSVDSPGSTPDSPLALVQGDEQKSDVHVDQEIVATPHKAYALRVRAKYDAIKGVSDRKWLSYSKGDILYTDGVSKSRNYREYSDTYTSLAYTARNAAGKTGYVLATYVEFC